MAVVASVGELLGVRSKVAIPGHGGGGVVGAVDVVGIERGFLGAASRSSLDGLRLRLGLLGGGLLDRGLDDGSRLGLSNGRRLRFRLGGRSRSGLGLGFGGRLGVRDVLEDNESLVGGLRAKVSSRGTVGVDEDRDGLNVEIGDVETLVDGAGESKHGIGHGKSERSLHLERFQV